MISFPSFSGANWSIHLTYHRIYIFQYVSQDVVSELLLKHPDVLTSIFQHLKKKIFTDINFLKFTVDKFNYYKFRTIGVWYWLGFILFVLKQKKSSFWDHMLLINGSLLFFSYSDYDLNFLLIKLKIYEKNNTLWSKICKLLQILDDNIIFC